MRWAALAGLVPLVLVAPALDRAAATLAVSASPVLRGAEALQEKRYDQRVLDDLEAVKNLFPEDADLRFLLGCLYQQLGQNDRAVAEYTVAAQVSTVEVRALDQPGGHPLRGRRLRRGPGGLPGGPPPRPAGREGPLQPLPRLRRDLPDRGGAGEARRGARARQRPRHAVPRQPDAREGRLPRLHARGGAGEGPCPAERLPQPPRPRALPRRERRPHLDRAVRRGHSPGGGRRLRPRLLPEEEAWLRPRLRQVRADVLPPLQAARREPAPLLAVHPRLPEEGRRLHRDEAPESRGGPAPAGDSRGACEGRST